MMNLIRRFKLTPRMAMLIGIVIVGFLFFAGWAFRTLAELKVNGPVYRHIVQGKDLVADILPPPEYIIEPQLIAMQMMAGDGARLDGLAERLQTLKSDYDARHAYWQKQALDPTTADILLREAHEPAAAWFGVAAAELVPALKSGNREAAAAAMRRLGDLYDTHRHAIDRVVTLANKRIETDEASAAARVRNATIMLSATLVLSLGAVVGLSALIARSITQPLAEAVGVARLVAAGDLSSRVESAHDDEPGELLRALADMNGNLVRIVGQVRAGTDTIATASGQIAAGNLDLSGRTEQQAASLEEAASSMEELTATVRQNADNARQANQVVVQASDLAVKGGAVVGEVVATMNTIKDSSRKIADITGVIDGIAFQTNILALNAAVEAARAGEQGRGFAVVASEVRSLAQRSAAAAKEIKMLIGDSVDKVDNGARLVDEAGGTMASIVTSVRQVADIMGEIAAASQEQSSGIEQFNRMVAQMDEATQQNAALVEQAAAAATSLENEAGELTAAVAVFRLAEPARRAAPRVRAAPRLPAARKEAEPEWETM